MPRQGRQTYYVNGTYGTWWMARVTDGGSSFAPSAIPGLLIDCRSGSAANLQIKPKIIDLLDVVFALDQLQCDFSGFQADALSRD
jgi:hypothetical protein